MSETTQDKPKRGYIPGKDAYSSDYAHRQAIRDYRADAISRRKYISSLIWTVIGTIIPGTGLLKTRAKHLGMVITGVFLVGLTTVALIVWSKPQRAISFAIQPHILRLLITVTIIGGLGMVVLITATHLLLRPARLNDLQRGIGAVLVSLMCFFVTLPTFVVANYLVSSSSLINKIFKSQSSIRSETRPDLVMSQESERFWESKPRINLLLLGGDSADDRNPSYGVRTDTIILASIDTHTGDTVMVQLPRNMMKAPFDRSTELGKKLAERYPDGFRGRNSDESLLNALWNNVPEDNPELFKNTDFPGADALKIAVAGTIGLMPDYFVMIDIDGIQALIDAMGGVTLNVNEKLPMGGGDGRRPVGWLQPGPNQHLSGYKAMWYARSRQSTDDYHRMGRQTCLIKAIIDQSNPSTMLTKYEAIAEASSRMVKTDIPAEMLPHLVDLSWRVKDGKISRVLFVHGQDGYNTVDPNFDQMKKRVEKALQVTKSGASAGANESNSESGLGSIFGDLQNVTPAPGQNGTTAPSSSATAGSGSGSGSRSGQSGSSGSNGSQSGSNKSGSGNGNRNNNGDNDGNKKSDTEIEVVSDVCGYHPVKR